MYKIRLGDDKIIFQIVLTNVDYIELTLWIISIFAMGIIGISFFLNYKKLKNTYFLWISLFFFLFIIARIFRLIVRFYLGDPTLNGEFLPILEGDVLIYEILYTISSYCGLFFIYLAIERTIVKKTHYAFTILAVITCILTIIAFIERNLLFIAIPLFLTVLLAFPIIYVYLAIKSSGKVRRNAIMVVIGIICFEFGVVMDIPEGSLVFGGLPPIILATVPPILTIIACFFSRKGFSREL